MYFSEQGNVDDDATFITIFLVSFNLQSCCLMQSAVCSLQSAVCSLQSAVCSMWSAFCSLRSAVFSLRSAVCSLRSAVCSLRSAVCSLQYANVIYRKSCECTYGNHNLLNFSDAGDLLDVFQPGLPLNVQAQKEVVPVKTVGIFGNIQDRKLVFQVRQSRFQALIVGVLVQKEGVSVKIVGVPGVIVCVPWHRGLNVVGTMQRGSRGKKW